MRPAQFYSLAVPAVLGAGLGLLLVAGRKDKPGPAKSPEAAVPADRRLHVEAYQAEIAKAPVNGKLETMSVRPAGDPAGSDRFAEAAPPPVISVPPRPQPAPPAPAVRPPVQPQAFARAESPRPPAYGQPRYDRDGYDQAEYDDYAPRRYAPPQMVWAADPRARRGQAYANPAPQAESYEAAPPRATDASPSSEFGFRITVPVCRRAAQQGDPLAETAQCRQMLGAVREQARRCEQAWEDGDDAIVMSPACRQAAGFR